MDNDVTKRVRISLEDAPTFSLTQRRRQSTSNGVNRAGGGTQQQDADVDHENDDRWSICPKSTDEPSYIARVSNYALQFVEICGWSGLTAIQFFNLKNDLHFLDLCDSRGMILPAAERLKDNCISLKDMEAFAKANQGVVNHPVFVQVVAKRKMDVFVTNQKINIIPLIVVADKSGYAVVCCFNEGLAYIYNAVGVGDWILIPRCVPQVTRRAYHKGLFSAELFIDLELKILYQSVKSSYIKRFSPLKLSDFKLPQDLFGDEHPLKLPHEIEDDLKSANVISPSISQSYYDVAGVVSHVGRIERFDINQPLRVETLVDGAIQVQTITRYVVFRWVHLVDKTSKPVPVKVIVNNNTIDFQDSLVPGAHLVITNCSTKTNATNSNAWSISRCTTTSFSQIYACANIEKYCMLHPTTFIPKTAQIMIRANYSAIITRKDITWSIGGDRSFKITSDDEFLKVFGANKQYQIDDQHPLRRRETRRLYFPGMIWRVMEVFNEDFPVLLYLHKRYSEEKDKMTTEYNLLENFMPFNLYKNRSWYAFSRKLPPYDPIILQAARSRDMSKRVVATYKKLCSPLLLPAELGQDELPPMADLDRIDGPPYLLLDIVNDSTKNWYRCIWKSPEFTHEEMLAKVTQATDKTIHCVADVFCIEIGAALEVNLHDFVVS